MPSVAPSPKRAKEGLAELRMASHPPSLAEGQQEGGCPAVAPAPWMREGGHLDSSPFPLRSKRLVARCKHRRPKIIRRLKARSRDVVSEEGPSEARDPTSRTTGANEGAPPTSRLFLINRGVHLNSQLPIPEWSPPSVSPGDAWGRRLGVGVWEFIGIWDLGFWSEWASTPAAGGTGRIPCARWRPRGSEAPAAGRPPGPASGARAPAPRAGTAGSPRAFPT